MAKTINKDQIAVKLDGPNVLQVYVMGEYKACINRSRLSNKWRFEWHAADMWGLNLHDCLSAARKQGIDIGEDQ